MMNNGIWYNEYSRSSVYKWKVPVLCAFCETKMNKLVFLLVALVIQRRDSAMISGAKPFTEHFAQGLSAVKGYNDRLGESSNNYTVITKSQNLQRLKAHFKAVLPVPPQPTIWTCRKCVTSLFLVMIIFGCDEISCSFLYCVDLHTNFWNKSH